MAHTLKKLQSNILRSALAVFAGCLAVTVQAGQNIATGSTAGVNLQPSAPTATNSHLRRISEDVFELGKVRLDKKHRTVAFPAVVNLKDTVVEYLIVTDNGKTHESLLRTEVEPYQIHTAMLLLGAKGAATNAFPEGESAALPGERVALEIRWQDRKKEKTYAAEDLVLNRRTRSAMTSGPWIYNGSRLWDGTFVAQQDGSIVSLITDPDALINNPRAGREDDENWLPNAKRLPEINSTVHVTIKLLR